ncbi:MAG: hypothetical protein HC892_19870 [Saprospiraceae bacterium]|nr:hypothetical protein [Saprospiraceae bacterium]
MTINQLDSTKQYIVELHEGENNLQYSFTSSDTATWKYRLEAIRPSNYFYTSSRMTIETGNGTVVITI